MKRYFKREYNESAVGPGVIYNEFDGEWATRQVEVYGDRWFSSLDDYNPELDAGGLADKPLSELDLGPEYEISQEEFEDAWQSALRRR